MTELCLSRQTFTSSTGRLGPTRLAGLAGPAGPFGPAGHQFMNVAFGLQIGTQNK